MEIIGTAVIQQDGTMILPQEVMRRMELNFADEVAFVIKGRDVYFSKLPDAMKGTVDYYLAQGFDRLAAEYFAGGTKRLTGVKPNPDFTLLLTYEEREERIYPNILFARDGEVYDLDGKKAIAIGGAYSIDKAWRTEGQSWWADEQPSLEIKTRVEQALDRLNWQIDIVLSHTTPLKYEPVEVFLPGIDQSKVDKSTEEWLDGIEKRLEYEKWYCGHYHTEKQLDRLRIMFNDYIVLESK